MNALLNHCEENSPYLLANEDAYQAWRSCKLENRRQSSPLRVFALNAQGLLTESQLADARKQVEAHNFIIFETPNTDFSKHEFVALNRQFGLHDLDTNLGADADKVTALHVVAEADQRAQYIPYTNRAMNWHTDGYYNPHARRINAFSLYCVNQSVRGGGNFLFDHEMMYLLSSEWRSISSDLTAFCNDSLKLRPIAIVSPTDFMLTPRRLSAAGNFSKVKRGSLVTT